MISLNSLGNSATFSIEIKQKNIKTLHFNIFIDVINRFSYNIFFFIPYLYR